MKRRVSKKYIGSGDLNGFRNLKPFRLQVETGKGIFPFFFELFSVIVFFPC